jgi:hypothetical protein
MPEAGVFAFEDCPLKHYVRKEVWLPLSKERLKAIRRVAKGKPRRLRYFTFCAVGALDVLLLDREKVVQKSETGEFDNVYFFDRDEDSVVETRKRIPGANGFPGDFVKVVLQAQPGDEDVFATLDSPPDLEDTQAVREAKRSRAQLQLLVTAFPFDVINLDVEQYLFRPKEQLPGNLTNALRRIFNWQCRQRKEGPRTVSVQEFSLMLTTQVGPKNLPANYLDWLRTVCFEQNIAKYQELTEPFLRKSNGRTPVQFFDQDFDGAFKLAIPKSLAELAIESDWYLDGDEGISVYQFQRASKDGPYCMLHMAMTFRRQSPDRDHRGVGQGIRPDDEKEHRRAIQSIFESDTIDVDQLVVGGVKAAIETDLQALFAYRERYLKTFE